MYTEKEKHELDHSLQNKSKDWSKFSTDLLCEILRRLTVVDHIHSSAVCTSWHYAAKQRLALPIVKPPWLMIPDSDNPQQKVSFISLLNKEKYNVTLPINDFADRYFMGSSCGWLITTNPRGEVHMLNPLSGVQIELPSISTFPDVSSWGFVDGVRVRYHPVYDDGVNYDPKSHGGILGYEEKTWRLSVLYEIFFHKAIVIPTCPTQLSTLADGYIVVAIINNYRLVSVRSGDKKWTIMRPPPSLSTEYISFHEIAYIRGVVYALGSCGKLYTWDIHGGSMEEICCSGIPNFYLVPFNLVELAQDILLVRREALFEDEADKNLTTKEVYIYKLDVHTKSWTEVKTLGHYCLFVGVNQALSFSTLDFPMLRANSIYFTDSRNCFPIQRKVQRDMGVFDFEEQKMVEQYDGYDKGLTWPLPLWLSPSPTDAK